MEMINGETISGDYAEFDLNIVNQITNLIDENFMSKLQSKLETAKQKSKENNIKFIEFVYEFFKKTYASELNLISHWNNYIK